MLSTDFTGSPFSSSEQSKPHPAILEMLKLHTNNQTPALKEFLSHFEKEKEYSIDILTAGVALFLKIANLPFLERSDFYGTIFGGLHYGTGLTKLWNDTSLEKINSFSLAQTCPSKWDHTLEEGYISLVYRGSKPSEALNKLLQGPTVIECGMFCQLAIWFGIRYMLGNDKFDQLFGKTPFYVTQMLYNPILSTTQPYLGNPLYPFFSMSSADVCSNIAIDYIPNHEFYPLKHPGGNANGANCVIIGKHYTTFDPELNPMQDKSVIEQMLQNVFNAPPNINDKEKIELYQTREPSSFHPKLQKSYSELIELSRSLSEYTTDKFSSKQKNLTSKELKWGFDFKRFCEWINQMKAPMQEIDYKHLAHDQLKVPSTLTELIPFENRDKMSFSTFQEETLLQKEIISLAKQFCFDVINQRSRLLVLTGNAGIGKTASAVSCAKELTSRGKKVIWISEVTVNGWANKAESLEELTECKNQIQLLLATNPDAVFLDDDNLTGYSGEVLLEEIYTWYVCQSGKGLFITSNEPVSFAKCYGLKLDGKYHFPPFPGYTSEQFGNIIISQGLIGESHRPKSVYRINELSDMEKINKLISYNEDPSVGIIISRENYEKECHRFATIEFIPSFNEEKVLAPIRQSLKKTGLPGSIYEALSVNEKKWLKIFPKGGMHYYAFGKAQYTPPGFGIAERNFEKTDCSFIALDLIQEDYGIFKQKYKLSRACKSQLLNILNYAHDNGNKKVIFVNNTGLSHEELYNKIKESIPKSEKERSISRLEALLFTPALFNAVEDNPGQVQNAVGMINQEFAIVPYFKRKQREDEFVDFKESEEKKMSKRQKVVN